MDLSACRRIIHVDMDAFFASIEQRDNSELTNKAIVVGGSPEGRGVVAAASYEARRYGIRSAMSSAKARQLYPQVIFVPPRFSVYRHISNHIMGILRQYSDLVEPLSLDEAYIDATKNKKGFLQARHAAEAIRQQIFVETGLTASAGVAPNKFLAKIASDLNKPNGLAVIPPQRVDSFLETLPIRKVPGIGKVTEAKMISMGIQTVGDLRQIEKDELVRRFGKSGSWYFRIARGKDNRPVEPIRERKSISVEDTFSKDLTSKEEAEQELELLCTRLSKRIASKDVVGKTLTLKVTYNDFQKITRSLTAKHDLSAEKEIFEIACRLLEHTEIGDRPIRLLGVGLSQLEEGGDAQQLDLFTTE